MKLRNRTNQHFRKPEIRAKDGTAEILLYDEIGFFGTGAEDFAREISGIDASEIRVRINSPGGDVFDGVSIFNAIRRHPAAVTTHIDGLAASIASVIALAGEKVFISENGFFMIHDPFAFVVGNAKDMMDMASLLDKISDGSIVRAYADKTGMPADDIRTLMAAETWFTSEEAIESGFADEVAEASGVEASFNLSVYNNVPDRLNEDLGPTVAERALRDVGFSRNAAKKILSRGFTEEVAALCDAGTGDVRLRDAGSNNEVAISEFCKNLEDHATEYQLRNLIRRLK